MGGDANEDCVIDSPTIDENDNENLDEQGMEQESFNELSIKPTAFRKKLTEKRDGRVKKRGGGGVVG